MGKAGTPATAREESMRGEVLHYDDEQGFGFINGADGKRYAFERSDLRRLVPVSKGTVVEFQVDGATAREIFIIRSDMRASAPAQFGRDAFAAEREDTGLWSYFVRTLTSNYANFRGRARRKEYWGYVLFLTILLMIVIGVGIAWDNRAGSLVGEEIPVATFVATGLFVLATLIPGIALTVRRQHDIGLSGWFYLLVLVPYVGGLIVFVFTLIPSQKHDNKWGPVPYGVRV
jgi:uncharacterized membrane protein YhaH (DUF805 family)/cold shock CspA family protein